MSRLPQIVLSELGVIAPENWSLWWWVLIGTALFVLTFVKPSMRPLRGYFLIMTMIYVVTMLLGLLQQTSIWNAWVGPESSWLASFFGDRLGVVLIGLSLAGILGLLGHSRREYFLATGDLRAEAQGLRLRWTIVGPVIAIVLAGLTTIAILSMNPLPAGEIASVTPLLPAIIILALMNAFGEELAFRAAPLSQLWQAVGKRQAILMVALWFGLGHYYGGISFGAAGAVFFSLVAFLFGKAMLETKGLAVPVFMHMLGDIMLFGIIALGSL
jgi:membrane protease YdiL (CAAX protease family)